jgi:NADH-quinone oxidoreductase subunit I
MLKALKEIYQGSRSLVTGMRITLGQFFKPTITVHYPHETLKIPPRFRGHIELVRDPETGKAVCFACKLCERACPSDCIVVEGAKLDGAKKRSVSKYILDFTKCSLCGSCVEACRDGAIRFSRDYNLAATSKEDFIMDLFNKLQAEAQVSGEAGPVSTPSPAAAPAVATPPSAPAVAPVAAASPQPAQPANAAAKPKEAAPAPATPDKPAAEPASAEVK